MTKGTILKARSIGDSECIFTATVLDRNKSFVTVRVMGSEKKVKVFSDEKGEYCFALGKYALAPIFR